MSDSKKKRLSLIFYFPRRGKWSQKKWVYFFSKDNTEGDKTQKDILGGKGANLAEMALMGLNVPPGFTISTSACLEFQKDNQFHLKLSLRSNQVLKSFKVTQKGFGKVEIHHY